jgi:hypothetical protein
MYRKEIAFCTVAEYVRNSVTINHPAKTITGEAMTRQIVKNFSPINQHKREFTRFVRFRIPRQRVLPNHGFTLIELLIVIAFFARARKCAALILFQQLKTDGDGNIAVHTGQ